MRWLATVAAVAAATVGEVAAEVEVTTTRTARPWEVADVGETPARFFAPLRMTVVPYLGGYRTRVSEIKRRFCHFSAFHASTWQRPLCSFFQEFARARRYKTEVVVIYRG